MGVYVVPWYIVAPSVAFMLIVVAVISWVVGRWAQRSALHREVMKDAEVRELLQTNKYLQLQNDRLFEENAALKARLRGILSLAGEKLT
jgi:hypothetical protein